LNERIVRYIEWARLPADAVFIVAGVFPALIAALRTYKSMQQAAAESLSSNS
jgi:predicted urease superfamily metal-dependent hydrolase